MKAEDFFRALEAAGADLHVEDVLDALWLATRGRELTLESASASRSAQSPTARASGEQQSSESTDSADSGAENKSPSSSGTGKSSLPSEASKETSVYAPGRLGTRDAPVKASPVAVPAGQALPGRLQFARALRPFRQRWPSRHAQELDEERTAEVTAELRGQLYPVFRPRLERWFDVELVLEDDPALGAWRDALHDFGQMLRDTGAFRDVRTWRLRMVAEQPAGKTPGVGVLEASGGGRLPAPALGGSGVRRLIFVASYGSSAHWADGSYARLIQNWSQTASVVMLHLLDRRHWKRSMLGDPHGECHALETGAPTADLRVDRYWWSLADETANVCVPIVPLTPQALSDWALMQMARGRRSPVYLLNPKAVEEQTERPESPRDFERGVALLRESSPEAFRLAVALSPSAFTLPVARLVQEARFGAAQPQRLAEVLLSGLVEVRSPATPDIDPNEVYYEFHPEARAVLLRSLRQADASRIAAELERRVSEYLRQIEGRAIRFRALIADESGQYNLPDWAQPFARLGLSLQGGVKDVRTAGQRLEDFRRAYGDAVVARASQLTAGFPADEISLDTSAMDPVLWQAVRDSRLVYQREDGSWTIAPEIEPLLVEAARTALLRGVRILWVDDRSENNVREIAGFRRRGATVELAGTTDEAVAALKSAHYDLVLSDMARPEGNEAGFALLQRIGSLQSAPPPVVIYAGNFASIQANRLRAVLEGAYGCTNSPEELEELVIEASGRSIADPLTSGERVILERVRDELSSVAGLRALVHRPELILLQTLDAEAAYRRALNVIHAVARSHLNHLVLVDGEELRVVSRFERSGKQYPFYDRADWGGLIGRAAREGATVWVRDVSLEPNYLNYESTTRSELVLTVKTRGVAQPVGVVNVEMDRIDGLTQEEIRWLERFVVPLEGVLLEELRRRGDGAQAGSGKRDPGTAIAEVNVSRVPGKDDYAIVVAVDAVRREKAGYSEYESDAVAFVDWLRSPSGGGLAAENVCVQIGDATAAFSTLKAEAEKLVQRPPGRRLYIYLYLSETAFAGNDGFPPLGDLGLAAGQLDQLVRRFYPEGSPVVFEEVIVLTEYPGMPSSLGPEGPIVERFLPLSATTKDLPRVLYVYGRSVPGERRVIPLLLDALKDAIPGVDSRTFADYARRVKGVDVILHGEIVIQPARASVTVLLYAPSPAGVVRIVRSDGLVVAASRLGEGSARFILAPGAYRATHMESGVTESFEITQVPDVVEVILHASSSSDFVPNADAGRVWLETRDQVRAAIQEALALARASGPALLREALMRWDRDPTGDVRVEDTRGASMVSVSEGGLDGFEGDRTLKDYPQPNHLFADLFGGVKFRWPIVLFLSAKNPPGVKVKTIGQKVSIFSLGPPYSLFEIVSAYDQVLVAQDICLVRAWFVRDLRLNGIEDKLVGSLRSFVSFPTQVKRFVAQNGARLVGAHTLVVVRNGLSIDLHALAESLRFDGGGYRVLELDGTGARLFAERLEEARYSVEELPRAFAVLGLRAVFCEIPVTGRFWRDLDETLFRSVGTVVVLVSVDGLPDAGRFGVFRDFQRLELDARLTPFLEQ